MQCKICKNPTNKLFDVVLLNKYIVDYFHCPQCGFLQTEEPYWLEEAYSESINVSDTGYIQRNLQLSQELTILLSLFFDKNATYLDYAGGYGIFVRLMRDIGFDFRWDDKYTTNLFARGFEYHGEAIEAITTFESFEHFVNPLEEIEKMLSISKNIIFSTELLPNHIPKPEEWWYYGLDHGQHISFYHKKTFEFIAEKYHLNYVNLGALDILSERRIPFLAKYLLKFGKFGLHKLLQKKLTSKIWEDYLKMSEKK